ncbi:MAG: SH3 domain-containing protein [Spirochaetia bacterium]|jgi:hypothetical protein
MRRALVPAALLALLPLLCCQPKPALTVPPSVVADAKSAFVIMADLPLFSMEQGALTPRGTLPIGEKLAILGQATRAFQAGKERDFVPVRRDSGSEGWVRADLVISKAILAVVTTDTAAIYEAPHNTAATTSTIPRLSIVAIASETGGMTFIKVTGFDAAAKILLRNVYLRNEGVSSNPDDVQSAILLQLAAASKNLTQQRAFLTSAIKDHPGSLFIPELNAALAALTAPRPAPPTQRATEPAQGLMVTSADGVSVYDAPDEKTGKLLGTLPKGQSVDVLEKTTDSFAIEGNNAPWFRIKEPAGWVFGASLAAPR